MSYRKKVELQTQTAMREGLGQTSNASGHTESTSSGQVARPADPVLSRAGRFIVAKDYPRAVDLLRTGGRTNPVQNALGVCLMRLGRHDEAVRILRNVVLQPNTTWMRRDLPVVYKLNYATALLIAAHPQGCLEMLAEISDPNPTTARLREAIRRWEASLPFWQKINWKFGRIEPRECRVAIDFEPGEFDIVVHPNTTTSESANTPAAVRTAL